MAKTVSDEKIIAALLTGGTIKEAAKAVGIAERTIYDRMSDGEFTILYKAAKADILRQAVTNLNSKLGAAINTVAEIMADPKNNAAVRLQAAQTIMNSTAKFTARLQADENGIQNQVDANSWGF